MPSSVGSLQARRPKGRACSAGQRSNGRGAAHATTVCVKDGSADVQGYNGKGRRSDGVVGREVPGMITVVRKPAKAALAPMPRVCRGRGYCPPAVQQLRST